MSKRRPRSDNPARRVIRINPPSQIASSSSRDISAGREASRRLHQHFIVAGLGDHHEAAVAQACDRRQRRFGKPRPFGAGRPAPSIRSLWRTGESPMRQSCWFRADGGSARDPPQHPGNAVTSRGRRVPRSCRYCRSPCSSAFSRVRLRSRVLRRRQHRRLAGVRIGHRHRTVTFPSGTKLDAMACPSKAAPAGDAVAAGGAAAPGSRRCCRCRRRGRPARRRRSGRRRRHRRAACRCRTADQDVVAIAAIGGELDARPQVPTPR